MQHYKVVAQISSFNPNNSYPQHAYKAPEAVVTVSQRVQPVSQVAKVAKVSINLDKMQLKRAKKQFNSQPHSKPKLLVKFS